MGLTPEHRAGAAPPDGEALAFGRAWAARVLGDGPLTDDERAAVRRAIRRCHAHAGLARPSTVYWVGSPDLLAAVVQRPRRAVARWIGWLLSPLTGAWIGMLAAEVLIFFWIALAMWLVIIGSVLVLRAALVALGGRWPGLVTQRSPLSRAALLGVVAVWGVGLIVAIRAVARPELTLPMSDGLTNYLFTAGALGGALAPAALWLRRRSRPVARPTTSTATLRVGDAIQRSWEAAGAVPPDDADDLTRLMIELDPLCRSAVSRPLPILVQWAWAEELASRSARSTRPAPWRLWKDRRRRAALRAFETAARVFWQPDDRAAVAVEPPREVHGGLEGLHRLDGPAVVWADGSVWYAAHGVRLPRRPDAADWTVDEIHDMRNTETRRMMIESIGWDAYLEQARLTLLADAPDPGNEPHRLELYELPEHAFGGVNLLVMTNGSPGRDRRQRRYAELVPSWLTDPVAAAAWQYGVPTKVYRQLQRRT